MEYFELNTQRLILRRIDPEVLTYLHQEENEEELIKVLGLNSKEELKRERERYSKGRWTFNKSFCYFQLILKNQGRIVGWCGYHTWFLDHDRAELGYELYLAEDREKGYMGEALPEVLSYGFAQMELHRIEALVGPQNIPSLKLIDKYLFQKEGRLIEHYKRDGKYEDSVMYALLKKNERLTH